MADRVSKASYDPGEQWTDPYESAHQRPSEADKPGTDRRIFPRSAAKYRLHIATHQGQGQKPLVAQGEVMDVSVGGLRVRTRHELEIGQVVDLAIPTKGCPAEFALPKAFLGKARVARIDDGRGDIKIAALAVDSVLIDDMSYAVFVEYHRRTSASAS